MINRIILLVFFVITVFGCKKEQSPLAPDGYLEFQNEGVILGYKPITNDCEGGYSINIYDPSVSNTLLIARSMPVTSEIDSSMVFPMKIVLNWEKRKVCNNNNHIVISKIKKVN